MNVLISSIGRRGYLARWFRAAIRARGETGLVYAADASPYAPGLPDADRTVTLPAFTAPDYVEKLINALREHRIGLALSVNDHELSIWAEVRDRLSEVGTRVIALPVAVQELVADKLATARALAAHGLSSPRTILASQYVADPLSLSGPDHVIVKHRFGSGSRGIISCQQADLVKLLPFAARDVRDRSGLRVDSLEDAYEALIIQEHVHGEEYGLDIVNDFSGAFQGVLARRKLRMRAGETDAVETTAPEPFDQIGRALSSLLCHSGLVDVDAIHVDGTFYVIDINPRFGGGYPFSHTAGADVPAAYLAWVYGEAAPAHALDYTAGMVAAKQDSVVVSRQSGRLE